MHSNEFSDIPPFPDDVPTAPLLQLSLKKLLEGDRNESERFFSASKDIGFFYLDLRNTADGEKMLEDAAKLFDVGKELFDVSIEEKLKYDMTSKKSYFGYVEESIAARPSSLIKNSYKGYGTTVVDKEGMLDRNEFYNVSPSPLKTPLEHKPEATHRFDRSPRMSSFASPLLLHNRPS
jgi:isopenicillin N synthase-like dioxygenase